ncbi:MAG: hypothetical protein WC261_08810 [Synergistaceae bacterium]|jgi:hypothetical protein
MANPVVQIILKAINEASDVIDDIKDSFSGLGTGAEDAEKVTSDALGDMFDNAMDAFIGINQGIELAMKAFDALKLAYDGTVGKVLEIAEEVEELMRISGDAPEDMSALRQVAKDAGVDFDDLYKAMENLNKNGVPPTLENLVAIADEYAKLEDPIEKARLLTKNFGEAGDEIAPMLEDIAGGVKNIQDSGSIFSEEDLQAAKDHEAAVAALDSAWDNFVITIGQKAIPVLTNLFNQISDSSSISDLREQLNDVAKAALTAEKITKEEYNAIMKEAYSRTKTTGEATDYLATTIGYLNGQLGITTSSAEGATEATKEMSDAEIELANAAMAAALEQAKLRAELDNITSIDANYKGIIDLAYEYTDILEEITEQQRIMAEEPIGSEKYDEAKGKLEDLQGTMTELANQVTLDMFQATIAVGGVTEAELAAYMQMAIDMGLMSEEGAQAAMDAYGDAIETINGYKIDDKTGNVIIDAAEAYATLVMIQQMQIADKTGNIDIFVKYHGTTPSGGYDPYENYTGPGGAAGTPANGQAIFAASGVSASTPYYWVGERGPEPFFPAMDGRIVSNTQAMAALRGGAGANAREIANAVRDGVREAMRDERGGNVYNLTMPTSSNPADVRTAFELMEAWGA